VLSRVIDASRRGRGSATRLHELRRRALVLAQQLLDVAVRLLRLALRVLLHPLAPLPYHALEVPLHLLASRTEFSISPSFVAAARHLRRCNSTY
jgi:hypothetical protein